ncbi:MAG: recombination protein RecR [Alphaproteobacteria bacterium]|nr:recombination protein RecR [Alphaproteobacteria bacterium]
MGGSEIERLVALLARLPGLGPRSARRIVLHLLERRETLLDPLVAALGTAGARVRPCSVCGNLDTEDPCAVCRDERRDASVICVVEGVADLWAIERAAAFRGRYHVLGGALSALDGIAPDDLAIEQLVARVGQGRVTEVILATNATVEGQTTAHYVAERLAEAGVTVSRLAHGVPVGGEIEYLDEGTLGAALRARREL